MPSVVREGNVVSATTTARMATIKVATKRSSAREKRAGSVTTCTNQSPTADEIPGSMVVASSFHFSQGVHTCCAPTPKNASCPAPIATT